MLCNYGIFEKQHHFKVNEIFKKFINKVFGFSIGCIHALYINDDPINFVNVDYRHKILPGCENTEQSCTSDTCQHGQCRLQGLNYKCICYEGYTGSTCNQCNILEIFIK